MLLCKKDAVEKRQHVFWPRAEVKVRACFPSALLSIFSMDYAYSRDSRIDKDRCKQTSSSDPGWFGFFFGLSKTWAWCNSDQGKFEPFARTVHDFLLRCSIVPTGNKTGQSLNWRIQAISWSSAA